MHVKFETALAHLERESEEKDSEIESANREIDKLVYELDGIREESTRIREDEAMEREWLEMLVAALKEVRCILSHQLVYVILSTKRKWRVSSQKSERTTASSTRQPKTSTITAHDKRKSHNMSRLSSTSVALNARRARRPNRTWTSQGVVTNRNSGMNGGHWRRRFGTAVCSVRSGEDRGGVNAEGVRRCTVAGSSSEYGG